MKISNKDTADTLIFSISEESRLSDYVFKYGLEMHFCKGKGKYWIKEGENVSNLLLNSSLSSLYEMGQLVFSFLLA